MKSCFEVGYKLYDEYFQKEFYVRATLSVPRDKFNMRLYKLKDYLNR